MLTEGLDLVVVDDNPVLVSVLSEIFSESGFKVRVAANGFGALAEIARRVPDILLSDLCMPGMSGYELLSVVRRRFPSIRVIAMSGGFSAEDIPSGIPADAFYAKGASSVAKLLDMVSSVWLHEASSPRSPTPVWIAETFSDNVKASALLVSCPECLRPFSHRADMGDSSPWRDRCPHCETMVEIALVRQSNGMDRTPVSLDPTAVEIFQTTMRATRGDGFPSGRMHQQ